jgi:hypothetical protein
MKKLLLLCLLLLLTVPGSARAPGRESFMLAETSGDPTARMFFFFSTSAGGYVIRHDGMGEFTAPNKMRRVFYVKAGVKSRIERVYFVEHDRDVFLLYEIRGQGFMLVRMEQTKRKVRWSASLGNLTGEAPSIDGDVVKVGNGVEISTADGTVVSQD